MYVGFAVIVTVGCCCCWFTAIVALVVLDWPVLLEQFKVYVVVLDGVTTIEPDVGSLPDQPPDAVQLVVLVEVQESVEELP